MAEPLEERWLPTVYTVNTVRDVLNDTRPGQVTLRDVLTALNTNAPSGNAAAPTPFHTNSIFFDIGSQGPTKTKTITLSAQLGALPAILPTQPLSVNLDGRSQGGPGYTGPPLIVLNGAAAGAGANGLDFEAGSDNSSILGLVIQHFSGSGLVLNGTSGIVVQDNYIGTNTLGTVSLTHYGNGIDGVLIEGGATANTIGGTAAGTANLLSGNGNPAGGTSAGVEISGIGGTHGNFIVGNRIGTDVNGTALLGNFGQGVLLDSGASTNTIGGTAAGAGNLVSGNGQNGVQIDGTGTTGNLVQGNKIGTDVTGTKKLGNGADGVRLDTTGATTNTIGGIASGAGNIISANGQNGVRIDFAGTIGNLVQDNIIGTDVTGIINLGNTADGVLLANGANLNTIGGAVGSGNTIANNAEGVVLNGSTTVQDSILDNSIYANTGKGIDLGNPPGNHGQNAPVLTVVTPTSVTFTLTSAPGTYRVELFESLTFGPIFQGQTFLFGNTFIVPQTSTQTFTVNVPAIPAGMTVTATATNTVTGDTSEFGRLAPTVYVVTTTKDILNDTTPGEVTLRDVLTALNTGLASGNAQAPSAFNTLSFHIGAFGTAQTIDILSALPAIKRVVVLNGFTQGGLNYHGAPLITLSGIRDRSPDDGLDFLTGSDGSVAEGLAIDSFQGNGVVLNGTQGIVVASNRIGTDRTGTLAFGNGGDGVLVEGGAGGVTGNSIGFTSPGAGNLISANLGSAVEIVAASNNRVLGNLIGTNVTGTVRLGSARTASANAGVLIHEGITGGATNNTVGGTIPGSANIIAFFGKGVVIGDAPSDTGTIGNSVLGNSIFSNIGPGIDLGNDGHTQNGANPGPFPNNGQFFPDLTTITTTSISGSLTSAAGTYRLEFFASPGRAPAFQGKTFLGFTTVTLAAAGTQMFTVTGLTIPVGMTVTATATNLATGDTSEFS